MIGTGAFGFLTGGYISFLMRPASFLSVQLPFELVISRGATLHGMDLMFVPVAQQSQSLNIMLAGATIGMISGATAGYFIAKIKMLNLLWTMHWRRW